MYVFNLLISPPIQLNSTNKTKNIKHKRKTGDLIDKFYIIKDGCCSVIKDREINGKKIPVFIGLIESLQYFGDEGFTSTDADQTVAKYTVIAGDFRKLKQNAHGTTQQHQNQSSATANITAKKAALKKDQIKKFDAPELLFMSSMAAKELFGEVAKPTHWRHIDDADLDKLMDIERMNRKWEQFKRTEMTRLIKERLQDPNVNLDQFRKGEEGITRKRVRWNV